MDKEVLKKRTKEFALRIIRLVNTIPLSSTGKVIDNQLLRSGTSVGANYRAACLGRSKAEFIAKIGNVIEEADESIYWMELLIEADIIKERMLSNLIQEAKEILAIMITTKKSAENNK